MRKAFPDYILKVKRLYHTSLKGGRQYEEAFNRAATRVSYTYCPKSPIYHNTDYHIKVIVLIRSMIFT